MAARIVAGALLMVGVLAIAPTVIVRLAAPPDEQAPPAVQRLLPEAKEYLANQLDLWNAHVRYTGVELRERDDLVILQFELSPFPFVQSEGAYLVSRCTPVAELDPTGMGGGRGVTDFSTDSELVHARSDDQPACP